MVLTTFLQHLLRSLRAAWTEEHLVIITWGDVSALVSREGRCQDHVQGLGGTSWSFWGRPLCSGGPVLFVQAHVTLRGHVNTLLVQICSCRGGGCLCSGGAVFVLEGLSLFWGD